MASFDARAAQPRVRIGACDSASELVKSWEVMADGRAGGGGGKKLPPMWKTLPAHLSSATRHYLNERKTIIEGSKSFYFIHN